MLKEIFYIFLSLSVIVSICGCTPTLLKFDVNTPAQTLTYAGSPQIDDQRPRFREIFCGLINQSSEAQQRRIQCEDYLHFLVDYPEIAKKVTALLSVAGVINGTPLADKFAETYANWFKNTPLKKCEPGDGGVLESLKRNTQFPWLAVNPLPQDVQYYSVVAFTHREKVQPGLLFTYDLLRSTDPRNDGQVIFYDQVIPGSSLLGYINLDHWAIAVPVREKMASAAWEAASTHPHVRNLLFEAMILFLVEKLSF